MRRWWVMQGVLCLVLVGAMGVAAIVCRGQAKTLRVELGVEEFVDGLEVHRPEGWTMRRDEEGLVMEEVRAGSNGRKLFIRHARSSVFVSPMEYLVRVGEISAQEAVGLMKAGGGAEREVVKMVGDGGWPGVAVAQTRVISGS